MFTNNDLILKSICSINDPFLAKIKNTYINSFPENERRDFTLLQQLIKNNPFFHVLIGCKEEQYFGFITYWCFEKFIYIEHFAIESTARNNGIGSAFLQQFLAKINLPVVLEVELPQDDLTCRRVSFYQRLGLKLDSHDYLQPPYHTGEDWFPLRLMTFGDINLTNHYPEIRDVIYQEVYGIHY